MRPSARPRPTPGQGGGGPWLVAALIVGAATVALAMSRDALVAPEPEPAERVVPRPGLAAEAPAIGREVAPELADEVVERALKLQRKVLEILDANKRDPRAASAAVESFLGDNAEEVEAVTKAVAAFAAAGRRDPLGARTVLGRHDEDIRALRKLALDLAEEAPGLLFSPEVRAVMAKLSPKASSARQDGSE